MQKCLLALGMLVIASPAYAQSSTLYATSSGSVGIGTNAPTTGTTLDLGHNTNSMLLPAGTTGQRPTGVNGMLRYNSDTPAVESYYGGAWHALGTGTGTVTSIATNNGITGGPITNSGTIGLATIGANAVLANPTGSTAVPIGTSVSALLDSAISNTQGSLIYRGASSWVALPPGTAGQVLQTQGASATPIWATASAGISSCTQVTSTGSASCDSGYTMTGGGCNAAGLSTAVVSASYPSGSTTWSCVAPEGYPTAYAICCH